MSVEARYNEGPRGDWQNLFEAFHYIEVLLHIFYYYWVEKVVRYIENFVI